MSLEEELCGNAHLFVCTGSLDKSSESVGTGLVGRYWLVGLLYVLVEEKSEDVT